MIVKPSRFHLPFDSLWRMRIDHPYSLMVREGGLGWSCGQCPLDANGDVVAALNLVAQTNAVAEFIEQIVSKVDMPVSSIAKLVAYHAEDKSAQKIQMISLLKKRFGDDVLVVPIKVPHFYYAGMLIEVDIHASMDRGALQRFEDDEFGLCLEILDGGKLIWGSLTAYAVQPRKTANRSHIEALVRLLNNAGVEAKDLLADQWFISGNSRFTIDAAAQIGICADPGAAVSVGFESDVLAVGELTYSKSSQILETWVEDPLPSESSGVIISARKKGDYFWITARDSTAKVGLVEQTQRIMNALNFSLEKNGFNLDQVCKATTYYVAEGTAEDLHKNMAVRNNFYTRPGPASTGLPVSSFPFSLGSISVSLLGCG